MIAGVIEDQNDYPHMSIYAKHESMKIEEETERNHPIMTQTNPTWEEYSVEENQMGQDEENDEDEYCHNKHPDTYNPTPVPSNQFQQTYSHNQFRLHSENKPRTIVEHLITKYAKEWKLHLESAKTDPTNFYNDIKTHITQYNVIRLS